MTGLEKDDLFNNTGDCLIEVTAWVGLTVYLLQKSTVIIIKSKDLLRETQLTVANFEYPVYDDRGQF